MSPNPIINRRIVLAGGVSVFNQYSVLYPGNDEYSNIDAVRTAIAATTVGTISFWIKMADATPASTEYVMSFGDANADETLHMRVLTNGTIDMLLRVAGTDQWRFDTNAAPFTDNTWHKCALVQDGSVPVFLVDGNVEATTFTNTTSQPAWFSVLTGVDQGRLGCNNVNGSGNSSFINANFDHILFINRAVTLVQDQDIYNGGTPKDESAIANGVSYFRIDGDTVPTMTDSIGSNDGTYVNTVQSEIELDVAG